MAIEDEVKPTRKDLMEIKDRIELSEQGHETLEKKRDGLIMEFMEILEESQDVRDHLESDYDAAQKKINKARALDGDVAVRGAASALAETPQITLESKNIMGVVVPQIEGSKVRKDVGERGYSLLDTSARIDEAAEAYEQLIETIIIAAEIETAMKKMLDEIEKTKRRVNALEFKLIPELKDAQEFIELRLEEMEREEIFRLKKIKEKKEQEEKQEKQEQRDAEEESRLSDEASAATSSD